MYAEKQPRKWVAGSDFFRRTRDLEGPAEAAAEQAVHLAATYAADGTIRLFRNGEPYDALDTAGGGPVAFAAGNARVLIGTRHADRGPTRRGGRGGPSVLLGALPPPRCGRHTGLAPA